MRMDLGFRLYRFTVEGLGLGGFRPSESMVRGLGCRDPIGVYRVWRF